MKYFLLMRNFHNFHNHLFWHLLFYAWHVLCDFKNQPIFCWYFILSKTRFSTLKLSILGPICRVPDTILIIPRITLYGTVLPFRKIAHFINKVLKVMLTVIIFVESFNKTELTDYRSGPNRSWWPIFMNRVKCVIIIDVLVEFTEIFLIYFIFDIMSIWKIFKLKDVPSNFKIRDKHNFYELSSLVF